MHPAILRPDVATNTLRIPSEVCLEAALRALQEIGPDRLRQSFPRNPGNGRLRPTQSRSCSGMHESPPPNYTIKFSHLSTIRSRLFLESMPNTLHLSPYDVYA
jgi:hypothetical protein